MRGRIPKDIRMHMITGTGRKDRHGSVGTAKSEKDANIKYGIKLDKLEAARFRRYKDYLIKKNAWKPVFATNLAVLVRQESIVKTASADLNDAEGNILLTESTIKGKKVSAKLDAWTQSIKLLAQYSEHFGFTPKAVRSVPELANGQLDLFKEKDPFKKTA